MRRARCNISAKYIVIERHAYTRTRRDKILICRCCDDRNSRCLFNLREVPGLSRNRQKAGELEVDFDFALLRAEREISPSEPLKLMPASYAMCDIIADLLLYNSSLGVRWLFYCSLNFAAGMSVIEANRTSADTFFGKKLCVLPSCEDIKVAHTTRPFAIVIENISLILA